MINHTLGLYTPCWSAGKAVVILYTVKGISGLVFFVTLGILGGYSSLDDAEALNAANVGIVALMGLSATFYLLTLIAGFVYLMIWVYRANQNLIRLSAIGSNFSPGWAVGWWFIPVFNLFRPYQMMKELWLGSAPVIDPHAPSSWEYLPPPPWLLWWWLGLLIIGKFSRIAEYLDSRGLLPPNGDLTFPIWAVCGVLALINALLVVFIVREIDSRQNARHIALELAKHLNQTQTQSSGW